MYFPCTLNKRFMVVCKYFMLGCIANEAQPLLLDKLRLASHNTRIAPTFMPEGANTMIALLSREH